MKSCPKCQSKHTKLGTYCSRSCANSRGPMTDEQREYRRNWAKHNPRGAAVKEVTAIQRSKWQVKRRVKYIQIQCNECGEEFSHRITIKRKYCSLKCSRKNTGGFKCSKQLTPNKSIYCGYQMDSGAEKYFAILLDQKGIAWIKNDSSWRKKFCYKKIKTKHYWYYPDFYLPQLNIWIEIKGKRYIRFDDEIRQKSVPGGAILVMNTKILNFVESLSGSRGMIPVI